MLFIIMYAAGTLKVERYETLSGTIRHPVAWHTRYMIMRVGIEI